MQFLDFIKKQFSFISFYYAFTEPFQSV